MKTLIAGDDGRTAFWRKVKPSQKKFYSVAGAAAYIGKVEPESECFGISKGQFSLIDIVEHVLTQIGPSDVDIATWTAADADAARVIELVESGDIGNMRWLIDRIVLTRQPKLMKAVIGRFGRDSVRLLRTHAKFVVFRGVETSAVVMTSMNLNSNPRFESFHLSADSDLVAYMTRFVDEIFTQQSKNLYIQPADVPAFDDGNRDLFAEIAL